MEKLVKRENKFAIFKYNSTDDCYIEKLVEFLDRNGQKVLDFWGIEQPKDKVIVEIIPTKSAFDKEFKLRNNKPDNFEVPKFSIGFQVNNNIVYLSINDYKNTTHNFTDENRERAILYYQKTLLHEFVHYVNKLYMEKVNCGPTQTYLSEGIACCLSGQFDGCEVVLNASCDELLSWGSNVRYVNYYCVVKYLLDNYGKEKFLELVESNRQAREFLQNELFDKVKDFYTTKNNLT